MKLFTENLKYNYFIMYYVLTVFTTFFFVYRDVNWSNLILFCICVRAYD